MVDLNEQQFGASKPEVRYHITDNPRFSPDPNFRPENNTTLGGHYPKGMFVSDDPEKWVNGHDYVRPWVAEIHVDPSLRKAEGVHGGYRGETFVPAEHFDKIKVHRVIPLDAYAREQYHDNGWIEEHHKTSFDDEKPLPGGHGAKWPKYRYSGPDARDMPESETQRHKERWLSYLRDGRNFDPDRIEDLRRNSP